MSLQLSQADQEFLDQLNSMDDSEGQEAPSATEPETTQEPEAQEESPAPLVPEAAEVTTSEEEPNQPEQQVGDVSLGSPEGEAPADQLPEGNAASEKETPQEAPIESVAVDFFQKVMAPLKAGGKTIQLKSPEEALELIKKGVDYTRKTQELAGDRKYLAMLDKHQLKDEATLSFLIDLANKKPEAIRKLVADAGIDPLDLDTATPVNYLPSNHSVSDRELVFKETLTDINSVPEGQELVQKVFSSWDQASQGHFWNAPDALTVLLKQKQTGIFDIVDAEVERRMLLGTAPAGLPRIEVYRQVGAELGSQGAFNHLEAFKQPSGTMGQTAQAPSPIATRVAAPKPAVQNNPAVAAAAPTRGTPPGGKREVTIDELAGLSDEEFLKKFHKLV